MIKKILSYLTPIPVEIIPSAVSDQLELTWNNGKLVLDTKHANYSYGNLQKVLRKGLLKIGVEKIKEMQHILVLGVAGGSVIKTLTEEFKFNKQITGVEIAPIVLKVAFKHFQLNEVKNLEIVIDDANKFVNATNLYFDLIIIDVFEDCFMPDFLYEKTFISNLKRILKPKGYLLFNTIVMNKEALQKNKNYMNEFENSKFKIQNYPNIDDKNEIIIIEKEYA